MEPILALTMPFLTAVAIVFMKLKTRNSERLSLIEKGMDPNLFSKYKEGEKYGKLRDGFFFIGAAVGALLGNVLTLTTELQTWVCYFSMIALCAGLGLIIGHNFIERKRRREGDEEF